MPNHRSASKRMRSDLRKRLRRRLFMGRVRRSLKDARKAISENNPGARVLVRNTEALLASGVSKGIIKRNTARRLTSRLFMALNKTIQQKTA